MTQLMKPLLIAAIAAPTLATGPAVAASLNKTYSYFSIGGTTLDEIQEELSKRGPHVQSTGARHPGATRMEFNTRLGYSQGDRGCQIVSAAVSVKAKVILPRWKRSSKAEADTKFIWATLESDIKRHEESHVVIAKNHARLLEQKLLAIGRQKTCAIAAEKAEQVNQKVLAQHDAEQQRFDKIEGINFEKRLMRLLKYRYERARTGRLAQ